MCMLYCVSHVNRLLTTKSTTKQEWAMPAHKFASMVVPYAARSAYSYLQRRMGSKSRKGKGFSRNRLQRKFPKYQGPGDRPLTFPASSFPRQRFVALTWTYNNNLSSSTTQHVCGTENVFKLNDVFDPAVGGESSQPQQYD